MMKKLSIVLSLFAALGFALAAPTASDAKEKRKSAVVVVHKKKGAVVVVHKKGVVVRKRKTVYVVGKSYNGFIYVGRKGYSWNGVWYVYGVGFCWVKVGDVWFWNPSVCPL